MSEKFHINPETGNVNKCSAVHKCRFGENVEHYDTREEARKGFEKTQSANTLVSTKAVKSNPDIPEWARSLPRLPDGRTFTQAWNDRFANLYEFRREYGVIDPARFFKHPSDLLDEEIIVARDRGHSFIKTSEFLEEYPEYKDSVSGEYMLQQDTRLGGGNRDCYCSDDEDHYCYEATIDGLQNHPNYVADFDDDFDSTYASFYFSAGITEEQLVDFTENNNKYRALSAEEKRIALVNNGELTPWSAIAEPQQTNSAVMSAYFNLKNRLSDYKESIKANKSTKQDVDALIEKAKTGAVSREELTPFLRYAHQAYTLCEEATKYQTKLKEFKDVSQALEQAQQLEDGPLKEWVLGDRGTSTYNATEKKGRRNVTVVRTIHHKPRLVDEFEKVERSLKYSEDSFTRALAPLIEKQTALAEKIDYEEEQIRNYHEKRKEAWALDWYGKPEDLPPIADDF